MKRIFKVFLILIAALTVLLGIGFLAIRLYFPPAKIKSLVLEKLSVVLHRQVRLGDVGLNPIKGLSLSNLEISERPTFADGTFLTIQKIHVFVALKPLLKKEVVIRSIVFEAPEITVIRNEDAKTFNYSDLLVSSAPVPVPPKTVLWDESSPNTFSFVATAEAAAVPAAAAAKTPETSAFRLDIARGEIKNGIVHFKDRSPAKSNVEISLLNLHATNISQDRPFNFKTNAKVRHSAFQGSIHAAGQLDLPKDLVTFESLQVQSSQYKVSAKGTVEKLSSELPGIDLQVNIQEFRMPSLPKSLEGEASVKGNANRLEIPKFRMGLAPIVVSGHGTAENLSGEIPFVRAHLETNKFSVQEALVLAPQALPPDLKISGETQVSADITGTVESAKIALKADGAALSIQKADVFRKAAGIPLDVSVIGISLQQGEQFVLDRLQVKLGALWLNGSGTLQKSAKITLVDLKFKTNTFPLTELAKFAPGMQGVSLTGNGALDISLKGDADAPQADGRIVLDKASAKNADGEASGVSGHIAFQTPNALAKTNTLTAKTSGQLGIEKIQHAYYRGNNAKLTWNLSDVTEDFSKISGDAKLTQGEGNLLNADRLAAQSKMARLMLQPLTLLQKFQAKGLFKQIGLPSLENIPFSSLRGDYKLQRGVMNILPFELSGADVTINTQGTIGLAGTQPINLQGSLSLAAGLIRGTVGQILQGSGGRTTLKFSAGGTVADPHVRLDLQEASKKALQSVGQELLKGILKKDSPAPGAPAEGTDAAGSSAEASSDPQKPLKDFEKALKGIFR